jgi:hypothetical protein
MAVINTVEDSFLLPGEAYNALLQAGASKLSLAIRLHIQAMPLICRM